MLFRKVFDYCIRCILWLTVLIIFTSLVLNCSGVVGQRQRQSTRLSKLSFDEDKDVETFDVAVGDDSEQMIGSASNVDRKLSPRVKLFDDIFNVKFRDIKFFSSL